MTKRWLKLAAVPIALSLVAAACGDDDDDGGSDGTDAPAESAAEDAAADTEAAEDDATSDTEAADEGDSEAASGDTEDFGGAVVTITGPERTDGDVASINDALNEHFEQFNLTVEYTGDADWEANINTQVEGGNPPDISFFPQPGKLADFARHIIIICHIRLEDQASHPVFLNISSCTLCILAVPDIIYDNMNAVSGKFQSDRSTDTSRPARNQRHLAIELKHVDSPFVLYPKKPSENNRYCSWEHTFR